MRAASRNTRSLRVGDKGTVFVGTRLGNKVTAIVKKDGKTEIKTIAEGLYRPNGLAFHKGTLYIAELSQISKIDNIEANLDKPPKPTVIYTDLPKDEAHGWKFIAIGPDNKLYIPVGQPGNNVLHSPTRTAKSAASIWMAPDAEVVARGVRNTVGFDWNPVNKQLYFSDNSRDWLSEDTPAGRAQPHHQRRAAFRRALLLPGQLPRSGIRLGQICRELRAAGHADRPALGRPRHALLHGQDVPGEIQERDLPRPSRLVEPNRQSSAATSSPSS